MVAFPDGAAVTNVAAVAARTAMRVVSCISELVRARVGDL